MLVRRVASSFLRTAAVFLWAALWFPAAGEEGSPNVVLILADDLGYGDPAFNNPDSRIPTPAMDRLAAEGMRFTDAHAPAAWCVPSRYGLLTGRYPLRSELRWRQEAVIPAGEATLGTLLKSRGYVTAMVGKWHLGFDGGDKYDFGKPLTGGPLDRGFDYYFGIPASLDIPPYFYIRGRHAEQGPTDRIDASSTPGWSPIQGAFWRAGPVAPGFRHRDVLPRLEQEAVRLIELFARSRARRPFFLYVALTAPHTPWLPLEQFRGKSHAGLYGDFVVQVDHVVGRILETLDRERVARDTLVIFTSDNGPVWYPADVERFHHSAAGPLRGMKADSWEGGHRVPFVVRWPGRVRPGSSSDELIAFTDIVATVAEAVGAPAPETAVDSRSFLPVLLGNSPGRPIHDHLVLKENAAVVRQGRWKLIRHLGSGGFSKPRRVEPVPGGPRGQLYDLEEDIGERRNLWMERPEIVERLEAILDGYEPRSRRRR